MGHVAELRDALYPLVLCGSVGAVLVVLIILSVTYLFIGLYMVLLLLRALGAVGYYEFCGLLWVTMGFDGL